MSSEKDQFEKFQFNQSLWHWYPLGQVDSIWHSIEHLADQVDRKKYLKEINAIFDALQVLDTKIRADRYPFPKKGVKRFHEILRKQSKRPSKAVPKSS